MLPANLFGKAKNVSIIIWIYLWAQALGDSANEYDLEDEYRASSFEVFSSYAKWHNEVGLMAFKCTEYHNIIIE